MALYNNYLEIEPTPAGAWLQVRRVQAELQIIRRHHPDFRCFVEIGPGYGVLAGCLGEFNGVYAAVEANEQIARYVVDRGHRVCIAAVPPLPIQSGSADVVYASHVIEHMPDPAEALFFVQEAWRVLKANGILCLSAPDLRAFGSTFWDADYTHCFPVTMRRIRQLLSDASFAVVDERYFSGPIQGPLSALLSALVKLMPIDSFFAPLAGERIARLRLTFLRNICVVARKR